MKTEIKTFGLKLDDADHSKGIIRGFASTFGNIDLGDDVVDPGAFKKTLQETKGVVPILADHDPLKQIGWNIRAEETEKGLYVEGKLNMDDEKARSKYNLVKQALELGAKMGLSIGYSVIKAVPDKERPSVRRLKELKLYEYSIVTFPMNTQAMVTAAKSWNTEAEKQENIDAVLNFALERGFTKAALISALEKSYLAAESEQTDPLVIEQSLDRLLNILKTT